MTLAWEIFQSAMFFCYCMLYRMHFFFLFPFICKNKSGPFLLFPAAHPTGILLELYVTFRKEWKTLVKQAALICGIDKSLFIPPARRRSGALLPGVWAFFFKRRKGMLEETLKLGGESGDAQVRLRDARRSL